MSRDAEQEWTFNVIYDHPKDWPDFFVVRVWMNNTPTGNAWGFESMYAAREFASRGGRYCFPREENDDPVIVETWF